MFTIFNDNKIRLALQQQLGKIKVDKKLRSTLNSLVNRIDKLENLRYLVQIIHRLAELQELNEENLNVLIDVANETKDFKHIKFEPNQPLLAYSLFLQHFAMLSTASLSSVNIKLLLSATKDAFKHGYLFVDVLVKMRQTGNGSRYFAVFLKLIGDDQKQARFFSLSIVISFAILRQNHFTEIKLYDLLIQRLFEMAKHKDPQEICNEIKKLAQIPRVAIQKLTDFLDLRLESAGICSKSDDNFSSQESLVFDDSPPRSPSPVF